MHSRELRKSWFIFFYKLFPEVSSPQHRQYRNPASLCEICSKHTTRLYPKRESAKRARSESIHLALKFTPACQSVGSQVWNWTWQRIQIHTVTAKRRSAAGSLSHPAVSHSQVLHLLSLLTRGIIFKEHTCRPEMSWLVSNTVNMKDFTLKRFTFYAMWNPSLW